MNIQDTYELIDGMNDDQLQRLNQYIVQEIKTRRLRKARRLAAELTVGDKVRINSQVKPKYLAGETAVITRLVGTKAELKLDAGPINKFRSGTLTAPFSLLEKVED